MYWNENVVIPKWLPPPDTLEVVKKISSSETSDENLAERTKPSSQWHA